MTPNRRTPRHLPRILFIDLADLWARFVLPLLGGGRG